jgi:hypothetical protein
MSISPPLNSFYLNIHFKYFISFSNSYLLSRPFPFLRIHLQDNSEMPSTTAPRTNTGLVPTTYHNKINRRNSTENWTPLPPRPPPERFPYRGDKTPTPKTSSTKGSDSIRKSHAKGKRKQEHAIKSEWNDCTDHIGKNDDSCEKGEIQETSRKQSLEYVRNSARKRTQLESLQRRLDFEIKAENDFFGKSQVNNDGHSAKDDHNSTHCQEEKNPLMHEVNRIKMALLSRLEDIDCDESYTGSANLDSNKTRSESDEVLIARVADTSVGHHYNSKVQGTTEPGSFQYSFGDASTLQTIDSNVSIEEQVQESPYKKYAQPWLNAVINDENSEGGTAPSFSTTSTWDNLSYNQHNRIHDRASELYKSKYKPQAVVENDKNHKRRGNCKDTVVVGPLKDLSTNSCCIEGLVNAISDGLFFTSGERTEQDDGEDLPNTLLTRPDIEISERQAVSSMLPLPRHPYNIPLEKKFRREMTQDEARY